MLILGITNDCRKMGFNKTNINMSVSKTEEGEDHKVQLETTEPADPEIHLHHLMWRVTPASVGFTGTP